MGAARRRAGGRDAQHRRPGSGAGRRELRRGFLLISYIPSEYRVQIDNEACIRCKVCTTQCSFGALSFDNDAFQVAARHKNCVACHRCVVLCPTEAINVVPNPLAFKEHAVWSPRAQREILKQAESGGVLLTSCGNDRPGMNYFEHMLLDASQVTNPSIDPLREPMELRTYLGAKPDGLSFDGGGNLLTKIKPQVKLETPIMFAAMSLGAIGYNVHRALAEAAATAGTLYNTGEGGLH